jgi:hypothetical protein
LSSRVDADSREVATEKQPQAARILEQDMARIARAKDQASRSPEAEQQRER